jgi:hypothetical protein
MHDNVRRARALMERSRNERFAVGAFNVDNQETRRDCAGGAGEALTRAGRGQSR